MTEQLLLFLTHLNPHLLQDRPDAAGDEVVGVRVGRFGWSKRKFSSLIQQELESCQHLPD